MHMYVSYYLELMLSDPTGKTDGRTENRHAYIKPVFMLNNMLIFKLHRLLEERIL